ncbi:MAG TPA: hypothetical protein VMS22_09790 [Candidatus Eisenbacteria bacterium]|nr:hypothetical protein [Candidatus Eisenbacteria bacterium]
MSELRIGRPTVTAGGAGPRTTTDVTLGPSSHRLWYEASTGPIASGCEPFVAATFVPALRAATNVRPALPISGRLLASLPDVADVLCAWDPLFRRVAVDAEAAPVAATGDDRGIGCFFSCGVDSFDSVLSHRDEITALVFVYAYEPRLLDPETRAAHIRVVRSAAAELGKPLIEIDTNVWSFADSHVSFHLHYISSFLASVALLLAPRLHKIYIPSTWSYTSLFPWGSHPLLDPLWSSDDIEIVHDGLARMRPQKVARIAASDTALRHLRVCYASTKPTLNCGRCEKCLRTMAALRMAGALGRCTTFDVPFDVDALAAVSPGPELLYAYRNLLRHLHATADDPPLEAAIRQVIATGGEAPVLVEDRARYLEYQWNRNRAALADATARADAAEARAAELEHRFGTLHHRLVEQIDAGLRRWPRLRAAVRRMALLFASRTKRIQ